MQSWDAPEGAAALPGVSVTHETPVSIRLDAGLQLVMVWELLHAVYR